MIRSATQEDYKKRQNWNVGTFHRASTLPETEASSGKPDEFQQILHEQNEKRLKNLFPKK